LKQFNTRKPNKRYIQVIVNAANAVNATNSALFGIENVTSPTRISVSRVNFSPCYSPTGQKRGDSNSNTTSRYYRESMTTIVFVHIQSIITKNE